MPISSNSLFHFTGQLDTLCKILKGGFWPKYCVEYSWGERYKEFDIAVPIVCFTDLPLSQIYQHVEFYGNYGIGMSRAWVNNQNNLSPVFYMNDYSRKVLNIVRKTGIRIGKLTPTEYEAQSKLISLVKKYKGKTINKSGQIMYKLFYEEREWRYIPKLPKGIKTFIKPAPKAKAELDRFSEETKAYSLNFGINDISFLLIKSESERLDLIRQINNIFSSETGDARHNLTSKILSMEQLKNDIV